MSEIFKNGKELLGKVFLSMRKLFQSSPVLGYIGAQTGSLIIQAVIAAAVGIAVGVRVYWSKISAFFSRNKNKAETVDECSESGREEDLSNLEASLLPESDTSEDPCSVSSTSETEAEE
ncbi:MAG: hypothetical protein JW738_07185 [Actinobacteria bacterium]|nr:hypothetical protein [Actinomycetota bacterium]